MKEVFDKVAEKHAGDNRYATSMRGVQNLEDLKDVVEKLMEVVKEIKDKLPK